MSRLRAVARGIGARPGIVAIVALGIAWGLVMHAMGWSQLAHFAQVRAFADGEATIDRWHWETGDKAWIDGHFYSVKSPGVAAVSTPLYLALDGGAGRSLAADAARNARATANPRWAPGDDPSMELYGYNRARADRMEHRVERNAPIVWALTLLVAVVPAVLLLLGVRWVAERLEPGYGTAAAITLGLGTIVMTFAAEYFSHVIAAALGFAAFMLLLRERSGSPRVALVAAAGLAAGLAVSFEYQVGLVGVILIVYALARSAPRLPRGAAYAAGALAGALPALLFNLWAFGSPFEFAYSSAVADLGRNGHAALGLNSDGFFGITAPRLDAAGELLVGNRGLLVLTPVVAMAVVGTVIMGRRGHRAEANTILAVALAYFIYNCGYWQPLGGGTPGPRFLIPALPFVAVGLAFAYRRLPALTLGLAIPSALLMLVGSMTYPLLGEEGVGLWANWLADSSLEHTLLTVLGVTNAWLALIPVAAAVAAAVALAVKATPAPPVGDVRPAVGAVIAWVVLAAVGPSIAGDPAAPLGGDPAALALFGGAALLALVTLAALRVRRPAEAGAQSERDGLTRAALALGERGP